MAKISHESKNIETAPLLKLDANNSDGSPGKSKLSAKMPINQENMKTKESNKIPDMTSTH